MSGTTESAESEAIDAKKRQQAADLLAWLEERRDEMVALLSALVRVESPSGNAEANRGVFDLLEPELESLGFETSRVDGCHLHAGSAADSTAERGKQLLLGHADTVWPLGTLEEWPLEINDGRLSGPGAYDMKAGLVQMVFALKALEALGLQPELDPMIFINSDEETGSETSVHHVERLAKTANRAYVLEPSLGPEGRLKTARKGVGRYVLTLKGRAAHSGLDPESGANAVLELANRIQELDSMSDPERGIYVNVGKVEGGLRPNMIAPNAKAWIDLRVCTKEDAEELDAAIRSLQPTNPEVRLQLEGRIRKLPLERTPRNQALWRCAKGLAAHLGLELEQARGGGASDGNTTSRWIPTLDGLGAVGDGAHAHSEYVRIDKLPERAALLALLLLAPPVEETA